MTLIKRALLALVLMTGISPAFAQAPAPVPALPDTERRTSYSISGSTCACAVNFALFGDGTDVANWLEVFVNGVQQVGNWTVTSPSGPIANLARPISDAVLTFTVAQTGTVQIVGARRPRRVAQFAENAGVSARNLNQALTDIIAQNRENWDKTNDVSGRAVLAGPGETLALLPVLASRQNMGACFDNGGNLTTCVSVPSGTFTAGSGIAFTGTNPTSISSVTLPVGANDVACFNGTTGILKDCSTGTANIIGPSAVSSSASIPRRLNVIDGNVGGGAVTAEHTPTALISRIENITSDLTTDGSDGPALLVASTGLGTLQNVAVVGLGFAQSSAIADTVGVYGIGSQNGHGANTGFGGFFNGIAGAGTSNGAVGIETNTANNTSFDRAYNPATQLSGGPFTVGADIAYQSSTNKLGQAGILLRSGGGNGAGSGNKWDVGIAIINGVNSADIRTDTTSGTILLAGPTTHSDGINLSAATFSGRAFVSNGFSVSPSGTVNGAAYQVGGVAGVTCGAGLGASTRVTNGIVTTC